MIRVFVADDHAIVRRGLADLFAETPDIVLVGEAMDGRAALQALERDDIDVFLLDLSLPKINGTEVLRRAHAARPKLPIVILSMYPEDQYADRLRAEGAAVYLNKGQPVQDVLAAIRAVALGKRPSPSARRPESPPPDPSQTAPPHTTLTAREYQIFLLLIHGDGVSDIAAQLNLTASTVSTHVGAIRSKLHARTIADLVRYAVREKIINE